MADDMAFAAERSFLAQEFLTWLWFRCEVEGGEFEVEGGEVGLVVEDALTLASWDQDGTKVTVRGGTPTLRAETAGALAGGLVLRRAKFLAARGDREWRFGLDGETLDLLGVKVPEKDEDGAATDEDTDELAEKLAASEELRSMVDALYEQFLTLRLGADWGKLETPRLQGWVRTKLEKAWEEVGAGA